MTATAPAETHGVLVDPTRDGTVRWREGERFHHVVESHVDTLVASGAGDRVAVDLPGDPVTFAQLDARANVVARHLHDLGVRAGDRVGLLFDRSAHPFVAMLAVSKLHAAYVPLDAGFPSDRIDYICGDADVHVVLTRTHLAGLLDAVDVEVVTTDDALAAGHAAHRPTAQEAGVPVSDLAYVIYTSGTTGRPKGVAIEHAAICNFLRVAAEHYGFGPDDRVYQGMTIAFDFSVEETWVPLLAGATLVPGPPSGALLGHDLATFLREREITALCCVPTLLATLEGDLPLLRFLLVSGEACPQDLVARWHRPDRRFLNVYGPTEATVTATWTELAPDRPVTIGVPLPTYRVVVLDVDAPDGAVVPLPFGATGEIAIAGIGLSSGYVGRPDLTAKAFVPDPLGLPDNPSGCLYRTGDLGRVDERGEVEYLGRIDTQVKVRGYRIELAEVESVLMELDGVAQAAVTTHEPEPGVVELAAFYTAASDADDDDRDAMLERVRERVPSYMVPSYLERLDAMPVLPSDKVDRSALPAPSGPRTVVLRGEHVPAEGEVETVLADAVAAVLGLDEVSATAHLFDDLGADSLRVARLCARVRAVPALAHVATQDVYLNPTVRALAAALDAPSATPVDRPVDVAREPHVASRAAYLACGTVQALFYVGYLLVLGVLGTWGYELVGTPGQGWGEAYLVSLGFAATTFAVLTVLPVAVKWLVVGRWSTEPIPVWSARYLRFWAVRTAVRLSPALLFRGSPLYNLYLRALGVRVGRGALVLTRTVPVCTDLVGIGARTVVREEAALAGYRVEAGGILPGRVDVGADALVGEGSLLDVGTAMGDGAHLAHASSLAEGTSVPAGRRFHGSPAVDAGPSPEPFARHEVSALRRGLYGVGQVATTVLVTSQLAVLGVVAAIAIDLSHPGRALAFGAGALAVLATVLLVVPRLATLGLRPDVPYRLYGFRWTLFQAVQRSSNSVFFNELFGDSSAIVGYLRAVGVRFRSHVQTGSNFGMAQRHHVPSMCSVGGGTIVSDGLAMPNGEFTGDSFRVRRVEVGERVFMGNRVYYPPSAALGDDCLLATKVMVPTDGAARTGVGLLGSPAFEIPRTVARDTRFDHLREGDALRRGLAGKNRHNLVTGLLYLLTRWLVLFVGVTAVATVGHQGALGLALAVGLTMVSGVLLLAATDVATRRFRRLEPLYCSLYDPRFWRHERYWKLNDARLLNLFDGTPFKALGWRLLGVRVGRQLFDDGATMPERSLVTLGDHVTLGAQAVLHGHSLEDGTFKSGRIHLGSGTTVGPGAWVHYDVTTGADVVVAPDSFLMKGEAPEASTRWRGNPARQVMLDA